MWILDWLWLGGSNSTLEATAYCVNWLFAHQEALSPIEAREEAIRLVGQERFDAALSADFVAQRLRDDVALANRFDVQAVPQIFVRNGRVSGTLVESALGKLLEE